LKSENVPNKKFVSITVPDVIHLMVVSSDTVFDTTKNFHTGAVFCAEQLPKNCVAQNNCF
jgi:hypothetical protein